MFDMTAVWDVYFPGRTKICLLELGSSVLVVAILIAFCRVATAVFAVLPLLESSPSGARNIVVLNAKEGVHVKNIIKLTRVDLV